MTQEPAQGRLIYPGEIYRFILGGNATFTLVERDGRRTTYKVKSATMNRDANWSTGNQDRSTYFVSVLTGPDNESSFDYMGLLKRQPDGYAWLVHTAKSKFGRDTPAWKRFEKCWRLLDSGCQWHPLVEFYHDGQCCMCGRTLTVPESVRTGIGPECAAKAGI